MKLFFFFCQAYYLNWKRPGGPSSGGGRKCAQIQAGPTLEEKWIAADCSQKRYFICEQGRGNIYTWTTLK